MRAVVTREGFLAVATHLRAGLCEATRRAPAVLLAWLGCASAALVRAQEPGEGRAQSFRAVEGAVKEDVPGGPLLVTAYALILATLIAYVLRLARLQGRAQTDLARLERALGAAPRPPETPRSEP
jgi:hypothetical protein